MTPPPTLQELIETVRHDAGSSEPLDQLVAAAGAAAQLEESTDALLGYFVDRCRRDGRSWTEISNALGVTKQAVHKRFAPALAAHIFAATPAPTFERFTDRARHVVVASRQAAQSLGAEAVGPQHLLLGLFAEPAGIAGRVLAAMNVSEDSVRAALRGAGGSAGTTSTAETTDSAETTSAASAGGSGEPADETPTFNDDARAALSDALAVALGFGHDYIGTEHLLLGLYGNAKSRAAAILIDAGALEAMARAHVADLLRSVE